MEKLVLDNSVLMKFVLENKEESIEYAKQILNDFLQGKVEILEPTIWYYEAGNVLIGKFDNRKIISEYFGYLKNLEFIEKKLCNDGEKIAIDLCLRYERISFYDVCYHALAIINDGRLITCDKKYYNLVKDEGGISLLVDY